MIRRVYRWFAETLDTFLAYSVDNYDSWPTPVFLLFLICMFPFALLTAVIALAIGFVLAGKERLK